MRMTLVVIYVFLFMFLGGCASEPVQVHTATPTQHLSAAFYSQKTVKRKVAIGRFTTPSNPFFNDQYNDENSRQAMDILTAKLALTEKFIILERSDLSAIAQELNTSIQGAKSVQADYLILGSITRLGRQMSGRDGILTNNKTTLVEAAVSIKIVDVHTTEVIYTEEGVGTASTEATAGAQRRSFDTTLNGRALEAAFDNLATNIVNNMLERRWKGYIFSKQNGYYLVSGGPNQGINQGDKFIVKMRGQSVLNPQTGMPVELPGVSIAQVDIIGLAGGEGNNEISWAQVSGGSLAQADAAGDYSTVYIEEM